ncbi:MAG: hypothetical protein LBP36_02550, partial [Oscillospiraceae bacterium]|nr:hypothetical protein [Oscillospiraceae bacterium]
LENPRFQHNSLPHLGHPFILFTSSLFFPPFPFRIPSCAAKMRDRQKNQKKLCPWQTTIHVQKLRLQLDILIDVY